MVHKHFSDSLALHRNDTRTTRYHKNDMYTDSQHVNWAWSMVMKAMLVSLFVASLPAACAPSRSTTSVYTSRDSSACPSSASYSANTNDWSQLPMSAVPPPWGTVHASAKRNPKCFGVFSDTSNTQFHEMLWLIPGTFHVHLTSSPETLGFKK